MDATNKKILSLLQENGRMTNAQLAERAGLSPASTRERVKKLEQSGVITKYVALVDPQKVHKGTMAFVSVSMATHSYDLKAFATKITEFPEVVSCYHIAGNDDFLLQVMVRDIGTYEDFVVHKLSSVPNVGRIRTSFVLSTIKNDPFLEID